MKKIVKGNDFTLRIPVSRMFNGVAEPFPLPGCTDIVVNVVSSYRRISLPFSIDVSDDHIINARVEGDAIPRGVYALEVKGKFLGNDWRSNEYEQFSIVDNNASGDTAFTPQEGEDRVLIPSPKVATYDLQPEMSAYAVTDEAVRRIESGRYDVIILNYANCDMVGHTGVFEAAVKAVEAVDTCLGRLLAALEKAGGRAFLTADHGNADQMADENGAPFTAHTTNPVPFVAIGFGDIKLRSGGRLADIAPTMLQAMGLPQPEEMTGRSLLE